MTLKQLLVAGLLLLSLAWVGLADWLGRKPSAPDFKDDGSLQAEITRLDSHNFSLALSVRVRDRAGEFVGGLEQDNFSISENGEDVKLKKFQTAGQQPLRACLVIDRSGSMDEDGKLQGAKEAAFAFLDLLRDGRDHLGLVAFETKVFPLLPVGPVDESSRALFRKEVLGMKAEGRTSLYLAMEQALAGMKNVRGRRLLLVLTDGIDNQGSVELRDRVIKQAQEMGVPLYMVGLGSDKDINEPAMKLFAERTQGLYLRTPQAGDLKKIYTDIGKSLQKEYALEYDSPYPAEDGQKRRVVVTVRSGKHLAKAEATYEVGGVLGAGGRTSRATGPSGSRQDAPFAGIFVPLLLLLGAALGLPYLMQLFRGPREAPTPAPAAALAPQPHLPPAPRTVPVPSPDGCPACGRPAPGPPGQRFCMVCDRTF